MIVEIPSEWVTTGMLCPTCNDGWDTYSNGIEPPQCGNPDCLAVFPDAMDVVAFGAAQWVYCSAHMKPHLTGWCGVSCRDKVGLGVKTETEAYAKCRDWGFALAGEKSK